jgi:hypothetical protein
MLREKIKNLILFVLFSKRETTKTILTLKENHAAVASDEAYGLNSEAGRYHPK